MSHKVSTIGVVNLTSAIGHPIDILTRVVAYRLNRAISVRPANDNTLDGIAQQAQIVVNGREFSVSN